ncbi:HNH endonuclease signature motif containing protein [Aquimarina pacifica]|uniref:HNH endonuclease signature motif containing protein n=1 Tax=Aquimarina pacifica TaxID=1296415 RepID=UPI0004702B59|nr:HNH endonuclease [Aquimarina pacifica]
MWNKIRSYTVLLLLVFGINQGIACGDCWITRLENIFEASGNTGFKNFIRNDSDGFAKFENLYKAVGSNRIDELLDSKVLNLFYRLDDIAKTRLTNELDDLELLLFADDFVDASSSVLRQFSGTNTKIIRSWNDFNKIGPELGGIQRGHQIRKNIDFLEKYSELTEVKRNKLFQYFSNQVTPERKKGLINYTHTKNIEGIGQVTIRYDEYGLPKFEDWIPDGSSSKFIYTSDNLGRSTDFSNANKFVAEKFGYSGSFGSNQNIRLIDNDGTIFEWSTGSQNFHLTRPGGERIKYTWHHHQDGRTLMPVQSRVHSPGEGGFNHSGGEGVLKPLINEGIDLRGFFESPIF